MGYRVGGCLVVFFMLMRKTITFSYTDSSRMLRIISLSIGGRIISFGDRTKARGVAISAGTPA